MSFTIDDYFNGIAAGQANAYRAIPPIAGTLL